MSLKPNTTYYYRVKAVTPTQESSYSNVIAVTTVASDLDITPIAPSNPSIYKIEQYFNKLDIYLYEPNPLEYIEEIKVTISSNLDYSNPVYSDMSFVINKNTNYSFINNIRFIVITLSNLASNTTYYLKFRQANKLGASGYTNITTSTKNAVKAPEAIGASELTAIQAVLNWNPVKEATNYKLDVSNTPDFSSLVVNNLDVGNVTSHLVTALVENTIYYFRVRAEVASILSNYSNTAVFTTLDNVETFEELATNLTIPAISSLENITDNSILVKWTNVPKSISYTVDISTSNTFVSIIDTITTLKTQTTFNGLNEGTTYYIRVKANGSFKDSAYSTSSATTLVVNQDLISPQLLTNNSIFSTGFLVNWVKRNYATRYLIEISTSNIFANVLASYFVEDIDNFFIDGLASNTIYYVRVYGLNSIFISTPSNTREVLTKAVLPTITLNNPSELTSYSVRLNWVLNNAYETYKVSIYSKFNKGTYLGNGYYKQLDVGNVNTHLVELFLTPNTDYIYQITGVTADGDEQTSELAEFTTRSLAPVLQFTTTGNEIEWSNVLNRLEISTDSDFKSCIQGWSPRQINSNTNKFNISSILKSNISYFIRGYQSINGIDGDYSRVISTYSSEPILLEPIIKKTSAVLRWKRNSSTVYRIQLLVNNNGNFIPVSGFTFPLNVGNVDTYVVENLASDTIYQLKIQYYDTVRNKYSPLSLPLTFKTNKTEFITELIEDTNLNAPELTLTNVDFDRFTITPSGTFDYFIAQISKRADFLSIEKYLELEDAYEFISEPNTDYYVRLYGVLGANRSIATQNSVTTLALPALPAPTTGIPNLNGLQILNENEVYLTWSEISNAIAYKLEVSTTPGFDVLEKDLTIVYNKNAATISGLSGSVVYYLRIYGYNRVSASPYSNVVTVQTTT